MRSLALAVDLGGTKVEAALVDEQGELVAGSRSRQATGRESDAAALAAAVAQVVRGALASLPDGAGIAGAGIGAAGPIDERHGLVSPINLPAWRGFPLAGLVAEQAGLVASAVRLRLDGQCITLAEHWKGVLAPYRYAMGMVVSTGVGGGLILDGRLVPGASGNAGHLGQVFAEVESGGRGVTVEDVASGTAAVAWARSHGWTGTDGLALAASYRAGDAVAVAAVRRSATAIGRAILSASALLDLEAVAIGGGFANVSADYFALIEQTIEAERPLGSIDVAVLPAGLGGDAPLIGAAALVHRV